jgi:hypothetical protein
LTATNGEVARVRRITAELLDDIDKSLTEARA